MVQDAEAHADEDKQRRELVDVRNEAEARIHQARKSMDDLGDDLDDGPASRTSRPRSRPSRRSSRSDDAAMIRTASDALMQAVQELATKAYEKAARPRRPPAAAPTAPAEPPGRRRGRPGGCGLRGRRRQIVVDHFQQRGRSARRETDSAGPCLTAGSSRPIAPKIRAKKVFDGARWERLQFRSRIRRSTRNPLATDNLEFRAGFVELKSRPRRRSERHHDRKRDWSPSG